jgi:hypothetical protein
MCLNGYEKSIHIDDCGGTLHLALGGKGRGVT